MTSLAKHHSNSLVKVLCIGDAKSGKTGALASLVAAGYKLRILDYDNLLDILSVVCAKDCPDKLDNVEFRGLRDKRKAGADGWVIEGQARAFPDGVKMLDNWKYKDEDGNEVDLGRPADWGPDSILVIDSLSRFCDAAYDWRLGMAAAASSKYDGRAVYGDAQDAIEAVLAGLTAKSFRTNVIVIAHVMYQTTSDGMTKGFPQGVGQKLSPKIPQYFPNVVLFEKDASGKRTLKTNSTALIDLANVAPFKMSKSYSIETGLAEFFSVLADPPKEGAPREAVADPQAPAPDMKVPTLAVANLRKM